MNLLSEQYFFSILLASSVSPTGIENRAFTSSSHVAVPLLSHSIDISVVGQQDQGFSSLLYQECSAMGQI